MKPLNFVFVCGDIGGANYQLPVVQDLTARGHMVSVLADPEGNGASVFDKAGIQFGTDVSSEYLDRLFRSSDLFFINTCATATKLEERFLSKVAGGVKTVMGSDGLFNHGFSRWQAVPDNIRLFWFAINEGHAQAIRELRPNLNSERVLVVGQPAFDSALDYIPKRTETRGGVRKRLNLVESDVVLLWWSQGMLDVISEDICMLLHGLGWLNKNFAPSVFIIPRIHPKLNKTVSDGYVSEIQNLLNFVSKGSTKLGIVDGNNINSEELCLAADVILSVTCTEDVKSVMMGGPPVVHLVGPLTQRWFETDLSQAKPYLPDVRMGQSLVAWSADQAGPTIERALSPDVRRELLANWKAPSGRSTEVVADKLVEIALM